MAIPESGILLTSSMVRARINADFAPGEQDSIEKAIAALSGLAGHTRQATYRLQLAVLKIAGGDPKRIEPLIEAATADFRDVLSGAEYPRSSAVAGNRKEFQPTSDALAAMRKVDLEEYIAWLRTTSPDAA